MFDLSGQAQAIVDHLDAMEVEGTVAFIEDDKESERYPVTLPARFLALDEGVRSGGKSVSTTTGDITWAVIVRAKSLLGPAGCLAVVDAVIGALSGFDPGTDCKPLEFLKVEFYDKKHESVAYVVRFSTVATGKSDNARCGR